MCYVLYSGPTLPAQIKSLLQICDLPDEEAFTEFIDVLERLAGSCRKLTVVKLNYCTPFLTLIKSCSILVFFSFRNGEPFIYWCKREAIEKTEHRQIDEELAAGNFYFPPSPSFLIGTDWSIERRKGILVAIAGTITLGKVVKTDTYKFFQERFPLLGQGKKAKGNRTSDEEVEGITTPALKPFGEEFQP